jgi:DNA-directed RNA polymerase subunit K/omega
MQHQAVKIINTDKLADIVGGRYALTCLVAKRLQEVNAGAPLLVEQKTGERLIDAVCREVEENKIWLEREQNVVYDTSPYMEDDGIDDLLDLD